MSKRYEALLKAQEKDRRFKAIFSLLKKKSLNHRDKDRIRSLIADSRSESISDFVISQIEEMPLTPDDLDKIIQSLEGQNDDLRSSDIDMELTYEEAKEKQAEDSEEEQQKKEAGGQKAEDEYKVNDKVVDANSNKEGVVIAVGGKDWLDYDRLHVLWDDGSEEHVEPYDVHKKDTNPRRNFLSENPEVTTAEE